MEDKKRKAVLKVPNWECECKEAKKTEKGGNDHILECILNARNFNASFF